MQRCLTRAGNGTRIGDVGTASAANFLPNEWITRSNSVTAVGLNSSLYLRSARDPERGIGTLLSCQVEVSTKVAQERLSAATFAR